MADSVSIAASVAGLLSAGIGVTNFLVKFYNSYKYQGSDLIDTNEKLESLLQIFESLEKTLSNRKFRIDEQDLIKNIETSIIKCGELIEELQSECDKFKKSLSNGMKAAVKIAGCRATYPFRQSTLQKLEEDIEEIRCNLSRALEVVQLNDSQRNHDDISEMRSLLNLIRTGQMSATIRD